MILLCKNFSPKLFTDISDLAITATKSSGRSYRDGPPVVEVQQRSFLNDYFRVKTQVDLWNKKS